MCSVCFCCDVCCCGGCGKPDVNSAIREARKAESQQITPGSPKPRPARPKRGTLTAAQRCKTKVVPGGVTSVQCTVEVHGSGTAQVFTLDGKSPVLTFGHETEFEPAGSQNRVTLAKKPGVCSLHAQITFYDSAFWYTHIDGESSRLNPVLGGGRRRKRRRRRSRRKERRHSASPSQRRGADWERRVLCRAAPRRRRHCHRGTRQKV